jgi:hypothetical protein
LGLLPPHGDELARPAEQIRYRSRPTQSDADRWLTFPLVGATVEPLTRRRPWSPRVLSIRWASRRRRNLVGEAPETAPRLVTVYDTGWQDVAESRYLHRREPNRTAELTDRRWPSKEVLVPDPGLGEHGDHPQRDDCFAADDGGGGGRGS